MLCEVKGAEKKCQEFEARARGFLAQGIKERQRAVKILILARESLLQREKKAEEDGEAFGKMEARLKEETLRVLERQEKFLNDFATGEPVEIAPGHRVRKGR